jgi:SNF2 family DNA or RNA helicase
MGLGKTLSTIALIHTVMTHHSMPVLKDGTSVINKVLVVVPSNTISNWMDEFKKWTGHLTPPLVVDSVLNHSSTLATGRAVERWDAKGGIFVMTDGKLLALFNKGRIGQPDLLVVDEAHSMLKVTTNKKFVALSSFETKRRILLTGTPFQNNLLEYFRMISFIRPNVFPGVSKESEFDAMYNKPIQEGEASDASRSQYHAYVQKTKEINALVSPYVHRKDASELRKVLPSLQQVVLHVRQSRIQCRLYNAYKRMQQQSDNDGNSPNYNNFLRSYQDQRPLHNHPGCLLVRSEKTKSDRASIDGGEKTKSRASNDGGSVCENNWWRRFLKPGEVERLSDVEAGYKIVLLLHILAASDKQNDKVLVFSESIPTLNFVEGVLAMPDWKKKVPSLASSFPEMQNLGGWKKDRDFLRIDGTTSSEDRGVLVDLFNSSQGRGSEVKAFLISTVAGGVGM